MAVDLREPFRALPVLETERLLLRPLAKDDGPAVFAYSSDPEVARYTSWEPAQSLEEAQAWVDGRLERYAAGDPAPWAVVHRAEQRLIGACGFTRIYLMSGSLELEYAFAPAYWGQGLATEAAQKAIEFAFTRTPLLRVQATCLAENVGSWRVMEKVGMRLDAAVRDFIELKGRRWDLKIYAILRSEWLEKR